MNMDGRNFPNADTAAWVQAWQEGFTAAYRDAFSQGFSRGFEEGLATGRREQRVESKCERKRAKQESKAQRYREKEAARAAFLAAGQPRTGEGAGSTPQAAPAPEYPPKKRGRKAQGATITAKEWISPDMVRLHATAPGLIGAALDKTDHYIKILLVPAGAPYSWPFDMAQVKDVYPKQWRPVTRTYTLRSVDTATGDIVVDFAVHGDAGLAAPWARDVEVGTEFGFMGPGGKWAPSPSYDHFVFAGDETAAPAIAAGLEKVPAGSTAVAFIEIEAPGRELPMPEGEGLDIRWVYREGAMPGRKLVEAVRSYAPPAGYVGWFVHGVAEMVKDIRRLLFVERGVSKRDVSISGYWRLKMTEDQWQATKLNFVAEMEGEEEAAARRD